MNAKIALLASACVLNRERSSSSHSSVAKKLSHMALSYASPTEPIEGRTPASRQRCAAEFIRFLRLIDRRSPPDIDLHLIVDNYAAHKTAAVKRWLARHP